MGQFKDLRGKVFGDLLVLDEPPLRIRDKQQFHTAWRVRCRCGVENLVRGYNLTRGSVTSCGCAKYRPGGQNHIADLRGCQYGYLTVIDMPPIRTTKGRGKPRIHWNVLCACGGTSLVAADSLMGGNTRSCGCLAKCLTGARSRGRPFSALFNKLKRQARERGHKVGLTLEQYQTIARTNLSCHYCKAALEYAEYTGRGRGITGHNLDRKDNLVGYVVSNCVPCCARCNRGKGADFTYEEWYRMTQCFRDDYERDTCCSTSLLPSLAAGPNPITSTMVQ